MKLFASVLLTGALLSVGCHAQNSAISSGTNGTLITSGGGWVTTAPATFNPDMQAWSCASNGACWSGPVTSLGQRKPKPKYTLAQVRASAVAIPKARLAPAAYLTLAKSIGLESAGTDEARMLDCLDKLSLKPYDVDKVDAYLTHKAEAQRENIYWLWKPLRKSDEEAVGLTVNRVSVPLSPKRYGQAVPAHALETVAMVLRELPDAVFLVSDYEAVKPDPFLAVTTARLLQEGRVWIVDVWQEPGFGVPEMHFGPAVSTSVEAKQPEAVRLAVD
jgi:hypothetical protein